MDFKINVLKEPRGFIRVLQFVFSICAFATTTNYASNFSFTVNCTNSTLPASKITEDIRYPFRLDHLDRTVSVCGFEYKLPVYGDYSSDSQFFVASGVLSMFYSLGSVVFYCLCETIYKSEKKIPITDFLVTMLMAVFWLSGSAAWASGLSALKYITNPSNLFQYLNFCQKDANLCVAEYAGNFAGLNISIIFGFLNFFLWASNLWFLYKETSWYLDIGVSTDSGLPPPGP